MNESISGIAKKIVSKWLSDEIWVINKISTDLTLGKDLPQKVDLIISEIFSSELVGEGIQISILDAKKRLLKENGKMIPEGAELKLALLKNNSEIRDKCFTDKMYNYDLSDFNQITGNKFSLNLGDLDISFLSDEKIAFKFDFYSDKINKAKQKVLEIPVKNSGTCLGIVTWMKINLYEEINLENNPTNNKNSHWTNIIYTFEKPLEVLKGNILKIKASLFIDSIWFELIS